MCDTVLEGGLRHVLFVDVVSREVSGNTCKHVNVTFTDRLGERNSFSNVYMEVRQMRLQAEVILCQTTYAALVLVASPKWVNGFRCGVYVRLLLAKWMARQHILKSLNYNWSSTQYH